MVVKKAKRKNKMQKMILLVSAALLFTSGCGSRGETQEAENIEIFYHADDGEFDIGYGSGAAWDTLPEEMKEGKVVVTLVALDLFGEAENMRAPLTGLVNQFNRENEKYWIELETCDAGAELKTMRDRVSVEIGAGGGPDIMTSEVFPVTQEIMDSGILVNLAPYLERSGVTPRTYFPAYASAVSGDRIYGINYYFDVDGYALDPAVLGDREPPEDVEALADLLLEYPGHGSFVMPTLRGQYILAYFLEGSEDLWGMIDWEGKTCDFTGPLFSKLIEVARRYREDGQKGYDPVVQSYSVATTWPPLESIQKFCPGSVPIGFYFDDGIHYQLASNGDMLMINANTEHLEGAYAFLSYTLCKKGQNLVVGEPVNKEIWESNYQDQRELSERMQLFPDPRFPMPLLDDKTRQETMEIFEDARYVSMRASAILNIIYEEADSYLEGAGDVKLEDVIDKIQNRAQLYLDERK